MKYFGFRMMILFQKLLVFWKKEEVSLVLISLVFLNRMLWEGIVDLEKFKKKV